MSLGALVEIHRHRVVPITAVVRRLNSSGRRKNFGVRRRTNAQSSSLCVMVEIYRPRSRSIIARHYCTHAAIHLRRVPDFTQWWQYIWSTRSR